MKQKKYSIEKIGTYKSNKTEFISFRISSEENNMLKKLKEKANIAENSSFFIGMIKMLYETEFSQIYDC